MANDLYRTLVLLLGKMARILSVHFQLHYLSPSQHHISNGTIVLSRNVMFRFGNQCTVHFCG
jgi:hypothetical protein